MTQALTQLPFQQIRLIATDMDGTLTQQEKFTAPVIATLEQLAALPLPVLIVTGRSAGWVSGLCYYLPVVGAIAENGGIFFRATQPQGEILSTIADIDLHRQKLAAMFAQLQSHLPQLQPSADNPFRLTDWTFDVTGLSASEMQTCAQLCHSAGWGFTYSTVQCHIKLATQDKAQGIQTVIQQHFPELYSEPLTQILTVGDSPNDESMFDPAIFPLSVGVANLAAYRDRVRHFPPYLTRSREGAGFCELAQSFLRQSRPRGS